MENNKIIDMHAHLWLGRIEECRNAILKAADMYSYESVYVSTLRSYIPDEAEIEACNTATAEFMRDYPNLVGGWCYVNPKNNNSIDVIKRYTEDCGMVGVKLWCATKCDDILVDPIAEYCVRHDLPVLIHALDKSVGENTSIGINVRNLALRHPKLRIIMAHLGGNEYTGIRAIADCKNVMVDICGVVCRADTLEYAVERIGTHRLMYGTDISSDAPFWMVIGRVNALPLPDEDKRRILYTNAHEYGL